MFMFLAEYFVEIRKSGSESDGATRASITSPPKMEASATQCLTLKAYAEMDDTETFEITADGKKADDTSLTLLHTNIFDLDKQTVVTFIEIPDGTYRLSIDILFEASYLFVHEMILSLGQCNHNTFRKLFPN